MIRTARIVGLATLIGFLFRISQQLSAAWGHEDVGGYSVALGVVSLLTFIRAAATEYTGAPVPDFQKDISWGISLGAFVCMVSYLTR